MGKGDIKIEEMWHPCLEHQPAVNVIPNDVAFVRGESEFHIITGANMGE